MKWSLTDFIEFVGETPSLSPGFYMLQREMANPNATFESISAIILREHGLALRLLRIANSAMYGFPRHVDTISDAVQIIGLSQVRDLTMAMTVVDAFRGMPKEMIDIAMFWKHSVAVAVAAGLLAKERHEPNTERFFLGGLLHDIGRLALYMKAPSEAMAILDEARKTGSLEVEVEKRVLGFDHAELGGALLEKWNLPPNLVEMTRYHHEPTLSQFTITESSLVHLADFLANALGIGTSGEAFVPPLSDEGWQRTHLDENQLIPILQAMEKQTEEMCRILTTQ